MQCPLCGCTFDEQQMSCHTSCAFNKGCAVICCPNCGYQMVDESRSRLAAGLQRLLNRLSRRADASGRPAICPVSALRPGESGKVVAVETDNTTRLDRLHVFGVVPGAQVTLEQRYPELVLRVGFTDLSLERAVADEIMVEPL